MTDLVRFVKNTKYGQIIGKGTTPIEKWGPDGNRKFAHITTQTITFPHIDRFRTLKDLDSKRTTDNGGIILTGSTDSYTVDGYDDNMTSLNQYFLEHPTREGIQYLIFVDDGDHDKSRRFKAFIPGLLYASDGTILAYLHSYVADGNGYIQIEIPYGEDKDLYEISGPTVISRIGNIITIYISALTPTTLTYNGKTINFTLYKQPVGTDTFTVKTVNEFGDYTVAAGLTNGNVKNIIEILSGLEEKTVTIYNPSSSSGEEKTITEYFPTKFISLLNETPSEEVRNMTPNIYKVPAAFVPTDDGKVFMTDVIGISANEIKTE